MPSWRTTQRALTARLLLLTLASAGMLAACAAPKDRSLSVPIPLSLEGGLLYAYGEPLLGLDGRCGVDPGDAPPDAPPSPRLLLDVATPLSVVSDAAGRPPQPFRHGQVQLNATQPNGTQGVPRLLLCDVPLLRGNQAASEFRLERQAPGGPLASSGALGAVLGGDLFARFALTLRFAESMSAKLEPQFSLDDSDITPSCFIDDAVLPFQPVGGDLQILFGDPVLTYRPTRITVAACVEPVADPFIYGPAKRNIEPCIDPMRLEAVSRDPSSGPIIQALFHKTCESITDLAALGDAVESYRLRRPAYQPSGVNMRFLVSTAVPDLLLSETACRRLSDGGQRCQCDESQKVKLRLPGLNGPQPDGAFFIESGCPLRLGGTGRAALALVARELQLSPCAELARSRRQRYALPATSPPPGIPAEPACLREACLENLARQPGLTLDRCAYTGMQLDQACDDHRAPVASYVEIGGPQDDPMLPDDTILALVVPDSARVLQSANTDLRNMTSQIDGVLGVSLLTRLKTVVDYPQNRLVLSCRCSSSTDRVCRAYRGVSYHDADSCVPKDALVIPDNFARTSCR